MSDLEAWINGGDATPAAPADPLDAWVQTGAARDRPGLLTGMAGSITNGAMFGFADEAKGALRGGLAKLRGEDFTPTYERERDNARADLKAFGEDHPVLNVAGNLGGGIGGALIGGAGGVAAGGTRLAAKLGSLLPAAADIPGAALASRLMGTTAGRGVTAGAAGGGLSGFGEGEGGFSQRMGDAATGAGVGAIAGPALAVGANMAGKVGAKALDVAGLRNPQTAADRQLLRALERDGVSVDDLAARAGAAQEPAMLPDLAGRNTTNLAAVAANTPGASMEAADAAVQARRAGTPDRMAAATDQAFGGGAGDDVAQATDALRTRRSTEAAPLYERARNIELTPEEYGRVAPFVQDPIGQQAMARGLRVVELEHLAQGRPFNPAEYGVQRGEGGALVPIDGATPNMRLMDAVKRGFDDIVEGFRDPTSGRLNLDEYGRAVNSARASYRDQLAEMFHPYRRALEAWSGPSQSLDAVGRGRNALTMDRDTLQQTFSALPPGDQEFFRLGMGRAVADSASDPATASGKARRFLEDRQMQARLDTAIPDPAQREAFTAALQREVDMAATNRAVSPRAGSQTGRLQAGMDDMGADPPGGFLMRMLDAGQRGGITGAASHGLQALYRRGQGINSSTADALAQRLFSTDPAAMQSTVQGLQARRTADLSQTEIRQALANRLLLGVGGTAGALSN